MYIYLSITSPLFLSEKTDTGDYVQENWLLTLRNLVSQINETFSRNFQEMAVAGEVSLGIISTPLNQNENLFIYNTRLVNGIFLVR